MRAMLEKFSFFSFNSGGILNLAVACWYNSLFSLNSGGYYLLRDTSVTN